MKICRSDSNLQKINIFPSVPHFSNSVKQDIAPSLVFGHGHLNFLTNGVYPAQTVHVCEESYLTNYKKNLLLILHQFD